MKQLLLLIIICTLFSCTDNQMARTFGGTEFIELKKNEELVNVTWKDHDMWVLTKDTTNNVLYFREHSNYGVWEGEVIFK